MSPTSLSLSKSIWQIEAAKHTPKTVAGIFALEFWDRPRAIDRFEPGDPPRFCVENGTRWYYVVYVPAIPLQTMAVYHIIPGEDL